jgi:hypothetical protein
MIRLTVPPFVAAASVRLLSGRTVEVPADRIVVVGEDDARWLVDAGWPLAKGEPPALLPENLPTNAAWD